MNVPLLTNIICESAIIGIEEGKKNSLSVIYDCLGKQMYALAYAILRNHFDAEDILQETLYEIVRCADTYKKGSNARAWILAITRNRALKLFRTYNNAMPVEDIEKECEQDFTDVFVKDALKVLPEDEQQIVIMKVVGGYRHKEIAEFLSISVSNSEKKYQRAIKKLKEYYEKED